MHRLRGLRSRVWRCYVWEGIRPNPSLFLGWRVARGVWRAACGAAIGRQPGMAQSTQAWSGGADWALQPPNPAVVRHWQQHLLPAMLVVEQRVLAYAIVATPPSVSASTGSHCDPVCEEASSPGDDAGENQASSSSTTAPCAAAAPISHWPRGCWRYRIAGAPIAVDLTGVCCWDDVLARALHMAAAITAAFAPPSPAALPLRQQNQPALRRPRQLVLHLALRGHLLSPSDYLRPSLRWVTRHHVHISAAANQTIGLPLAFQKGSRSNCKYNPASSCTGGHGACRSWCMKASSCRILQTGSARWVERTRSLATAPLPTRGRPSRWPMPSSASPAGWATTPWPQDVGCMWPLVPSSRVGFNSIQQPSLPRHDLTTQAPLRPKATSPVPAASSRANTPLPFASTTARQDCAVLCFLLPLPAQYLAQHLLPLQLQSMCRAIARRLEQSRPPR